MNAASKTTLLRSRPQFASYLRLIIFENKPVRGRKRREMPQAHPSRLFCGTQKSVNSEILVPILLIVVVIVVAAEGVDLVARDVVEVVIVVV